MIQIIGLMIGLYILARYCEMSKNSKLGEKILLAIFALITIICIIGLLANSASVSGMSF